MIFALRDLRKAIILWVPVHLLVNQAEVLWTFSPMLAIREAISLSLMFMFIYKGGFRNEIRGTNNEPFIFKTVFILYLFSYGISTILSIYNTPKTLIFSFKYFVDGFIFVYMFQKCLNTEEDIKLLMSGCIVITALIVGLGISEFILKRNLWQDYVFAVNRIPFDEYLGRTYYLPPELTRLGEAKGRFGLRRCLSTFGIHLGFGSACALLLFFVGSLWKSGYQIWSKYALTITMTMLIVGTLLSNSKGPMLLMLVLLFLIFKASDVFNPKILIACIAAIYVVITYFPGYIDSLLSITDPKLAEEGGGSSIALREQQLDVALNLFADSPLWGHGPQSLRYLKDTAAGDGILGAESVWLKTLPERGVLGVIAYLSFFVVALKKFSVNIPKRDLVVVLLGIGLIESTNGQRDMLLYVPLLIALNKYYELQRIHYIKQLLIIHYIKQQFNVAKR